MVNTVLSSNIPLVRTTRLVLLYIAVVVGTIAALVVLSVAGSRDATRDAWVHAAIVALFAVLLPLRLRAARRGSARAARAIGVIAAVLAVVNVVEAAVPGLFPVWMRVEMVAIAALMLGILVVSAHERP